MVVDRLVRKEDENFVLRLKDSLRVVIDKGDGFVSYISLTVANIFILPFMLPVRSVDIISRISLFAFFIYFDHGACETCHGLRVLHNF